MCHKRMIDHIKSQEACGQFWGRGGWVLSSSACALDRMKDREHRMKGREHGRFHEYSGRNKTDKMYTTSRTVSILAHV
jgi:hypothetical protein